jgi:beta-galactosidase beta subunit
MPLYIRGVLFLNKMALQKESPFVSKYTKQAIAKAEARVLAAAAAGEHTHALSEIVNLVSSLAGKEPANANIQLHIASAHAPATAQKNSDITKAEIEEKLTGEISSHTHAGGGGGLSLPQVLRLGLRA